MQQFAAQRLQKIDAHPGETVAWNISGLGSYLKSDELCKSALEAGFTLVQESGNLVKYTLQPDLRHWKKMPMAIFLTNADGERPENSCQVIHSALYHSVQLTPLAPVSSPSMQGL